IALPNSFGSALGLWLGRAKRRVGYNLQLRRPLLTDPITLPQELLQQHQVEYYLYLLQDICNDFSDVRRLELTLSEAHHQAASKVLTASFPDALAREYGASGSPLVGVAPGAAFGTAKRWPWGRYAGLIARLVRDHAARVVLVGSQIEREVADNILAYLREHAPETVAHVADTCGRLKIKETGALLTRC